MEHPAPGQDRKKHLLVAQYAQQRRMVPRIWWGSHQAHHAPAEGNEIFWPEAEELPQGDGILMFLKLRIANPWFKPRKDFKNHDYYWKDCKLSANKNLEIQISRFEATDLIDLGFDLQWWGQDHAGPELDINVFGYMFNIKVYDSRHWNWEANRWQTLDEAKQEADEWERHDK